MQPFLSRAGDPPDGHQVLVRRAVPVQPVHDPARGARDPGDLQQPPRHAQETVVEQRRMGTEGLCGLGETWASSVPIHRSGPEASLGESPPNLHDVLTPPP